MAQSSNKSKLRAMTQTTYVIPNDDSPKIIHNLLSMILGEFHFLSYYFSDFKFRSALLFLTNGFGTFIFRKSGTYSIKTEELSKPYHCT